MDLSFEFGMNDTEGGGKETPSNDLTDTEATGNILVDTDGNKLTDTE